jgi:hypothetical protein
VLRVAGQAIVAATGARWLPPMSVWYSGVLPYRILLPAQVLLIALMTAIAIDVSRGTGTFARPNADVGHVLEILSYVYFAAMIVRLGLRARSGGGRHWYEGGTVPTLFHYVLAGFLYTYARTLSV